jgi:hypothetical protein
MPKERCAEQGAANRANATPPIWESSKARLKDTTPRAQRAIMLTTNYQNSRIALPITLPIWAVARAIAATNASRTDSICPCNRCANARRTAQNAYRDSLLQGFRGIAPIRSTFVPLQGTGAQVAPPKIKLSETHTDANA